MAGYRCASAAHSHMGMSGCAPTQEAKSVNKSGFLGDYSMLREGKRSVIKEGPEDEALRIYRKPDVDMRKYKKYSSIQ